MYEKRKFIMAKLSVVICVYNTEEIYFEQCLKSVYESTVSDLEVIVVDDGSNKDYSKLLKKFNKVKYFKTENQGTLKARIFGARQATSPYICYVDSDDTVSFCYFEASLAKAEKTNADIVINDWAFHTEQTKYVCTNDTTIKENIVLVGDDPLKKFISQAGREHSYYVLWNKIFKREVLSDAFGKVESLNLGKMVFAEDVLLNYFIFAAAKKAVNVHLGYYFYRVHDSQQISVESEKKLVNHIEAMTKVFDIIEDDLTKKSCIDEVKIYFQMWKQLLCSSNYQVAKHLKLKNLYPMILEKYKSCKLKGMPSDHDKAYLKQRILPVNIDVIDTQLKKVYYSNKHLKVFAKKKSYAFEVLNKMKYLFKKRFDIVSNKYQSSFVFEKEKISIKQKILHNIFVYKLGMLMFPKGSKIRKILKSKL